MFLDVSRAFEAKNPKWYRRIPKFMFRWVERLIHQDDMNGFMAKHMEDSSIDFATHAIDFFEAELRVRHEENIPSSGRQIVVSNHPLGGLDGLALISVLGKFRQDIKFPVNDLLMQITPMQDVFIPINKHGRNNQNAVRDLNDVFASDDLILYFPAGLCSRRQKGVIADPEWKKTIVTKAREYRRDIIPAYFDGRNSNRFYNIANIRKKLKININIEMVLLPDEAFRQKGKVITVTFGPLIPYSRLDNSKSDQEWTLWLRDKVYALKNLPD